LPLSQHRAENGALRALYFLPAILPLISAAVLWQIIFASDGLMNTILGKLGVGSVEWLTSADVALWSLIIMVVWKQLGLFLVIFIAGLQSIPENVYHAASIDGSRGSRTFLRITLPLMQRTVLFVIVIATIGAMQAFVPAYIMFPSRGGPDGAVNVLPLYLYENAFVFTRMGYASTIAVVLFAILIVLSVVQFRVLRSRSS
jgi:multiple sugar transport system permease protein